MARNQSRNQSINQAGNQTGHDELPILQARNFSFFYGDFKALESINISIQRNQITALIGPSGCGKSTFLRSMNRMHDLTSGTRSEGELLFNQLDINGIDDLVKLRSKIGMIFQRANPFPMSVFDNVAFGLRLETQLRSQHHNRSDLEEKVHRALKAAALWDEVKDKLTQSGLALSGGQQQRLCIARAIAVQPEVLLMDEPCAALDPIATLKIEDLMHDLVKSYTIVIVTHNMQQAARVSDHTAFFMTNNDRTGSLVEYQPTKVLFTHPKDRRTNDYINGRFG